MLYLNPPFLYIEGVTVYPDHADPLQFYYLPSFPRLSTFTDETSGEKIPAIQLIKFRGKAGNGGFLNFDVNVGVDEDVLRTVSRKIQDKLGLDEAPRLAPVPLVDGSVSLMLFGKKTPESTGTAVQPQPKPEPASGEPVPAPGPEFVLKIDQSSKPSLYGDNQAAFSVKLDQEGVTVLEKALQGEMSPIGIIYNLKYHGLRPAYKVKCHVDWERVQKHFEEHFGVDCIFFSASIDKAIDKLIEDRVIVIDVDTFVPEGEDESSMIASRDRAVDFVRQQVTEAFFTPSLDPYQKDETWYDQVGGLVDRLANPLSSFSMFSYSRLDYTRIDKKRLNMTMNERNTVVRNIYPQGHLRGLCRVLQGMDPERFIMSVDLDDPWFQRRRVNVISRGAFAEDSLSSIHAILRYGNDTRDVVLEESEPRKELDWGSLIVNGAMEEAVNARFEVNFKSVVGAERPVSLVSPEEVTRNENYECDPRKLYSLIPVPIVALGFPWERFPNVEVQLRYEDPANQIRQNDVYRLCKDKAEAGWKMFVVDPTRRTFSYRTRYFGADDKDVESPWIETDREEVVLRDPWSLKRTLEVVPVVNWELVDRVFVDVTYDDEDNGVHAEGAFGFTKDASAPQSISVGIKDTNRRAITFAAQILFRNGTMTSVPKSWTLAHRIYIGADMKGHRVVTVRPPANLGGTQVRHAKVEARYAGNAGGSTFSDVFEFVAPGDRGVFEFDYVDEARQAYEYRVTYRYANGMARTSEWRTSSEEFLIVPNG